MSFKKLWIAGLCIGSVYTAGCGKSEPAVNITELNGGWKTSCSISGTSSSDSLSSFNGSLFTSLYTSYNGTTCSANGTSATIKQYFTITLGGKAERLPGATQFDMTYTKKETCSSGACVTATYNSGNKGLGVYRVQGDVLSLGIGTFTDNPLETSRPQSYNIGDAGRQIDTSDQ